MKKVKKLVLISLIAFVFASGSVMQVFATNKTQIEQKRQQAKNQVHKLKLLQRIETGKLYNNQKKLERTEINLNTSKVRYENAKNELEKLAGELDRQIAKYNEYQLSTNNRIVQIYKSRRSGYIEFLFSSGDLNDFLDRIYYENIIMNIDKKNMDRARASAANIRALKQRVERQKEYLASSIKSMDREQKNLQYQIDKNERMIYKLKNDIKTWERSERELARQSEQISSFIKNKQRKDGKTVMVVSSGAFIRPVSGPVTSPFGRRVHPIFKRTINHTGVDLGMPMGSRVKVSNSGKVIYVGWYGGYGKVVIVDHGKVNGIPVTTLYAHLSSYCVSNGTSVTKGQIIGNVGSTGYSTGPHLHFEVRENGRPVNPAKYAPI